MMNPSGPVRPFKRKSESDGEPAAKYMKVNAKKDGPQMNDKARKMMAKMGYTEGKGLESDEDERPSFGNSKQNTMMNPNGPERPFKRKSGEGMKSSTSSETGSSDNNPTSESDGEPAAKYMKVNAKVGKMMANMGYTEGKGLGKFGQGRTQIVEASKQKGRRGLGLFLDGLEAEDVEWNFDLEDIIIKETVDWLPKSTLPIPTLEEMLQWKVIGNKKRTIDDETDFISEKTLRGIINSTNVLKSDCCNAEEMRRARTRSNPYETIRGVFFLNRAAMKMANMDAVLDFMFTSPKDSRGNLLVPPNEILYFADVCAGPGGFSEYVLWRKKGDTKGFGMTLKGQNDFKVEDFFAGPAEMFETHYGVGDGDVFNPDNQKAFAKFVLDSTDGLGVHFVMADGGFSEEGQENVQEILSKQLYLCQFLVAMSILREEGNFVCKLFDLFTPFSMGLVYLMYLAFDSVSIFKPVTSRPANSERHIICKNKKAGSEAVLEYMRKINLDLCKYLTATSTQDVVEIVPLDIMKDDKDFYDYMWLSNENIGRKQIIGLKKIQAFCQNQELYEVRQSDVRTKCLQHWQVPDEVRTAYTYRDPAGKFQELIGSESDDFITHTPVSLATSNLSQIKSIYDFMCTVTGDQKRYYLLGLGKSHVFRFERGKWVKALEKMELPSKTLIEAETVQELRGEGKGQRRIQTVHILDAVFLCGKDVRSLHFRERLRSLEKFVKAVRKPSRSDLFPIVVAHYYKLDEISQIFDQLELKIVKGSQGCRRLCYKTPDNSYFHPQSLYFIKTVKEPWMMAISKSSQKKYFYNTLTRKSEYQIQKDCIATTRDSKLNSLQWIWEKGMCVHDSQEYSEPSKISRNSILDFVNKMK